MPNVTGGAAVIERCSTHPAPPPTDLQRRQTYQALIKCDTATEDFELRCKWGRAIQARLIASTYAADEMADAEPSDFEYEH